VTARRSLLIAAGVIAAIVLFVVLRPDDEESTTTTSRSTTVDTRITVEVGRPRTIVRIAVRGGHVVGGPEVHGVTKGDEVVIVVSSNVADEVHVHGYDLKHSVLAGGTARIAFRATLAGRFELELEEHRIPLGELEVLP
jgi:hypothetical protein